MTLIKRNRRYIITSKELVYIYQLALAGHRVNEIAQTLSVPGRTLESMIYRDQQGIGTIIKRAQKDRDVYKNRKYNHCSVCDDHYDHPDDIISIARHNMCWTCLDQIRNPVKYAHRWQSLH